MSISTRRRKRRKSEQSPLQIVEEGFHLLRTVEVRYYVWFYLGAVPFAVGLLYFAADQSRSSLADQSAPGAAALMVILYFWMRFCQARFCRGLYETINPGHLPERTALEKFRAGAALIFLQSLWLPLMAIGLFFALPLGWIVAALQNFTILAATRNYGDQPLRNIFVTGLRHSHYDWAQNHGVLLVLTIVGLFTWLNLVATCLIMPGFAKSFFGVESIFTISPTVAIMNTTFLLGSLLLTWMVISPMMKAAYTLRCFYADSRETGADLLSRLAACRKERAKKSSAAATELRGGRKAALIGILLVVLSGGAAKSQETVEGSGRIAKEGTLSGEALRESIGKTMEQKKYQWQLSRKLTGEERLKEQSWLSRRLEDLANATRDAAKRFGEWLEEVFEKWGREERRSRRAPSGIDSGALQGLSTTMSVGLVVLVCLLVAWLVVVMYRKYKGIAPVEAGDSVDAGEIDLHSEEIVASQLPEDEWMRLAREQMSKGDTRLAVRALFLATLSKLGEDGLLRIARFKTNRDYRVELSRKARKAEELRRAFEENTRLFERAWYGWHPVSGRGVDSFLQNHEAIARESGRVSSRHLPGSGEVQPETAEAR